MNVLAGLPNWAKVAIASAACFLAAAFVAPGVLSAIGGFLAVIALILFVAWILGGGS